MKIHEYQGKELLKRYGVAVPRGVACFSVDEAVKAAESLGGPVWVVKAQIHAGGRGKGGGVKLARSIEEVRQRSSEILGMQLITHQTSAQGQQVRRLLIEEGADIRKELYIGLVVDRVTQRVTMMASSEGGMDIEEVAEHSPEKIHKAAVDPVVGLTDAEADDLARKIGIPDASLPQSRVTWWLWTMRPAPLPTIASRSTSARGDRAVTRATNGWLMRSTTSNCRCSTPGSTKPSATNGHAAVWSK